MKRADGVRHSACDLPVPEVRHLVGGGVVTDRERAVFKNPLRATTSPVVSVAHARNRTALLGYANIKNRPVSAQPGRCK